MLQTLLIALLVGFALQAMGHAQRGAGEGVEHIQKLVFRILGMIMWAAPVGAFGAMAAVIGETGMDALKALGTIMLGFITCALFIVIVLGRRCEARRQGQPLPAAEVPRPGVPADRVHLVVRVRAAAAAHRQDGAPGCQPPGRRA